MSEVVARIRPHIAAVKKHWAPPASASTPEAATVGSLVDVQVNFQWKCGEVVEIKGETLSGMYSRHTRVLIRTAVEVNREWVTEVVRTSADVAPAGAHTLAFAAQLFLALCAVRQAAPEAAQHDILMLVRRPVDDSFQLSRCLSG